MKINLLKKISKFSLSILLGTTFCLTTFSCENFLSGGEFKSQLETDIKYANAPSYTIKVEAVKNTGIIKTPVTGEVIQKASDTFTVKFEPDESCKFIKWEAYSPTLDKNEKISDYIEFSDAESLETKVKFKKEKDDLLIRPVCPQSLKVSNFSLQNQDQEYPRDSSIVLTFNKPIDESCKDKISMRIPGLSEDKNPLEYFKEPVIQNNQLSLFTNIQTGKESEFIPVSQNGTKTVTLTLHQEDFFYINKDYSEDIKIYLEKDSVYSYRINSETSEKSKIRFALKDENSGSMKIDGINNDGRLYEYSIGNSFTVKYNLLQGYSFKKWTVSHTYTDENGYEQTEVLPVLNALYKINMSVSYNDFDYIYGYNKRENYAEAVFSVTNHIDGVITISAESYEPVKVKFEIPDEKSGVIRINNIANDGKTYTYGIGSSFDVRYTLNEGYTFDSWLVTKTCTDENGNLQTITITNLEELSSINLSANYDKNESGSHSNSINATFTVNGVVDGIITISALSIEPVQVKFLMEDSNSGNIKIDGNLNTGNKYLYKIGNEINFTYFLSDSYKFNSWKILHTYTNEENQEVTDTITDFNELSSINISLSFSDKYSNGYNTLENYVSAVLKIEDFINGLITIEVTSFEPAKFKFIPPEYGNLRVNNVLQDGNTITFSKDSTISVKYAADSSGNYKFDNWLIQRLYTNSEGQEEAETITDINEINLEKTDDEDYRENSEISIYNSTLNLKIKGIVNGIISITPLISEIPESQIKISGKNGNISPSAGTYTIKEGESRNLSFDADDAYEFIRWQIINEKNGNEVQNNDYIYIRSLTEENTQFTLVSTPEEDDDILLVIKPVITERPQVISCTPITSGVMKDSTVKAMFDYNMASDSIYYTDNELDSLRSELGIEENADKATTKNSKGTFNELLKFTNDKNEIKYYGYIKDDETYFKNIIIRNSKNDKNLLSHFNAPVFENEKSLSIPVNKAKPIPSYTSVFVSIEKDAFYEKENKNISMREAKKWIYQVNASVDENAPEINSLSTEYPFSLKDSNNNEMTEHDQLPSVSNLATLNYIKDDNLHFTVALHDDTENSATFTVSYKKVFDSEYDSVSDSETQNLDISYSGVLGEDAFFDDLINFEDIEEGIYSLKFTFKDQSGNPFTYPENENAYYFCVDKTEPELAAPEIQDSDEDGKISINWTTDSLIDYKEAEISYKLSGSDDEYTNQIVPNSFIQKELLLNGGNEYDIKVTYRDYAGNEKVYDSTMITRPNSPSAIIIDAVNNIDEAVHSYGDTNVKLKITKPESGNFNGLRIHYFPHGEEDESEWEEINLESSDNITETVIESLQNGTIYDFEICSYDSRSGKYSLPYKTGVNYPSFITLPDSASIDSTSFNGYTTRGTVSMALPSSNYTGIKIIYSKNVNFQDSSYEIVTKENNTNSKTIYNLDPGTRYYIKLQTYFENEENYVESSYNTTCTKPEAIASLVNNTSALTNTSINLNWAKPSAGLVDSYFVYYKKSTESVYDQIMISDSETLSYTIEELLGGTTYNIVIKARCNNLLSVDSSVLTVQTKPNPVTNFAANKDSSDTSKINLSWTRPTDNFTGVKIYYSTTADGLQDAEPVTYANTTTTSHSVSGLTTGNTYYFKIRTYINDSLYTDSETISCSTSINPVKNLTVTNVYQSSSQLYASWTNPEEFDGIRIYYSLYSSFNPSTSTLFKTITTGTPNSSSNSYITELSPNTNYYIHVVAYKNVDGIEAIATSSRNKITYPSLVTNISVTNVSPSAATVSWINPLNNTEWSYSYVYVYQNSTLFGNYKITDQTQTSYTVTGLTSGTDYQYSVRTYNSSGLTNSGYTTVTKTTVPGSPKNLTVTTTTSNSTSASANSTSATLSWQAPDGNVSSYNIYYALSGQSYAFKASTTSTSYTLSSLGAAKLHYFKVESVLNGVDNLTNYSYSTTSKYSAPTVARSFTASSASTTSITYTWTAPVSGCSGYYLHYKKSSDTSWNSKNLSSSTTSYTITNLTPGTYYYAYISAYYSSTSYSNATSTVYKYTATGIPTNLTARADNGGTTISWSAPSGIVNGYYLYYTPSGGSSNSIYTTGTSYNFTSSQLNKETNYTFYVRAYSSAGQSDATANVSFWTPPAGLSNVSIYSNDGMGNLIIQYTCPSSSRISGIDLFVDGSYKCMPTFTSGATVKYTYILANPRQYHTIRLATYHGLNTSSGDTATWATQYSNETYGSSTLIYPTYDGNLVINGTAYSYSKMTNVITSSYQVNKNSSGTDGAFTKNRIIYLSPYSMGTYEVTQKLYKTVMGSNPSNRYSTDDTYDNYPVENINWYHAIAFCNKLSILQGLTPCYTISGKNNSYWQSVTHSSIPTTRDNTWDNATLNQSANGYHLPTECQWEFAARGAHSSDTIWNYSYSGSNSYENYAWVSDTSSGRTHLVGTKYSNTLGIYDMTGNVYEWLTDWNNSVPYISNTVMYNPWCGWTTNTTAGSSSTAGTLERNDKDAVLLKGGSYNRGDSYCKNQVNDYYYKPYKVDPTWGMRLCRNVTY